MCGESASSDNDDSGDEAASGAAFGGTSTGGTAGSGRGGASSGTDAGGEAGNIGTAGDGAVSGGTGGGGSGAGGSAADGGSGGNACATKLEKEPVDIILIVDNSGSMLEETLALEQAIATELPAILTAAELDYRVILITRHRRGPRTGDETADDLSICVPEPLSGLPACPAEQPVFTERFFHYWVKVESADALDGIIDAYTLPDDHDLAPNGYGPWLREGVNKAIIVATDDDESSDTVSPLTADAFLAALTALSPANFGVDADHLTITFHSIVGLAEKADPTAAYLPSEPIVSDVCLGTAADIVSAGVTYQELSIRTNGLRFPICQFAGYGEVFAAVASDAVVKSSACDFAVPPAPSGQMLALDAVEMTFSPESGEPPVELRQVAGANECGEGAFYVENHRVRLCSEACTVLRASASGRIDISFPCE